MTPRRSTFSVIMGDLVGSRNAGSPIDTHTTFNDAVDFVNEAAFTAIASPLTITLGDEFQGLCHSLEEAVKVMRLLRLSLLMQELPCRFVIGQIELTTPLNTRAAWNMTGAGLPEARTLLNRKSDPNAYRFHLPDFLSVELLANAVGLALTRIESQWTPRQREIAYTSLALGNNVAAIASRLSVSKPNVYQVSSAGGLRLYEALWKALTTSMAAFDEPSGNGQ